MIRFFRSKIIGKLAKFGQQNKGRNVEEEMAEKKRQEAGNYTTKERLRVRSQFIHAEKKFPITRGFTIEAHRGVLPPMSRFVRGNKSASQHEHKS